MKYEKELKIIAGRNNHSFHKRSETQIELVRMMGDQIDSRFDIKDEDGEITCYYTFWIEGEGNKNSDEIYDDVTDYTFLEEIEKVMKKSNIRFAHACIDRNEKPDDW